MPQNNNAKQLWTPALIVVLVPSVLFLVGAVVIKAFKLHVPLAIGLALVLLVGIGFLLLVFATIAGFFPVGSRDNSGEAFGLPPGSIRAVLAIGSFVLFLIIVVYLFTEVFKSDTAEAKTATTTAATTIIGAVVTLIATVAAFYFGASSVKSGVQAFAAITGSPPPPPEAITKGSELQSGDAKMLDLVGNVNPHGADVRSYFEISDNAYDAEPANYTGAASPMQTVAAGQTAVEVRIAVPADVVGDRYWFRIVAVGPNGTAFGRGEQRKLATAT